MTLVHEIMSSDVLSISPTAKVIEALRMMSGADVRHLPVVEKGSLVGILSDRDIHRFEGSDEISNDVVLRHLYGPVSERMTHEPHMVASTATLDQAAQLMIDAKIGALPVVDGERLVGMLSTIDLLAWVRRQGKLSG
jgi:acetoin utilization protein AcuB